MKNYTIVIVAIGIFSLGVTKSLSQDIGVESLTAEDRHRISVEDTARLAELFEAGSYVNDQNDTLQYRLLKPLDFDPEKKYPLVVCLAGASARGTDNFEQVGRSGSALLAEKENRKNYPCFVFVPQCPSGHNWGKSAGTKWKAKNPGRPLGPSVDSLIFESISAIEKEFKIDKNQLYVTGASMGGTGAWHYILTRPQMFAAAIPVCGSGNPDIATKIINVPVWAFDNRMDKIGNPGYSGDMVEAIKNAGGNPLYTESSDLNHKETCIQSFYTPGLLDWLFSQKLD